MTRWTEPAKEISRNYNELTNEEFQAGIKRSEAASAALTEKLANQPLRDDLAAIDAFHDRQARNRIELQAKAAREMFIQAMQKLDAVREGDPELADSIVADLFPHLTKKSRGAP